MRILSPIWVGHLNLTFFHCIYRIPYATFRLRVVLIFGGKFCKFYTFSIRGEKWSLSQTRPPSHTQIVHKKKVSTLEMTNNISFLLSVAKWAAVLVYARIRRKKIVFRNFYIIAEINGHSFNESVTFNQMCSSTRVSYFVSYSVSSPRVWLCVRRCCVCQLQGHWILLFRHLLVCASYGENITSIWLFRLRLTTYIRTHTLHACMLRVAKVVAAINRFFINKLCCWSHFRIRTTTKIIKNAIRLEETWTSP